MLTKFETKSSRVKGISFHPSRPWILASLHSGAIQLWDYRIRTLVDKFEEHDGPVRGICFHLSQPLFVSGGDDSRVKVWNYKQRRCLFTLNAHVDYIRTVQFHHEHPWIVSASDDQTIRIWNWQARTCIAVLAGHNHYVMCASFHPREDLVVSASLDQTVRIWDISGLRRKNISPSSNQEDGLRIAAQSELFGNTDVNVKHVLEGHDRGVNWAAFNPTLPLIISGADDRQIKLWRMNETKAWEVDTLRGHFNNVSCVLFHPRQELVISNSEDKTIRIWDLTKRTGVQTFRREHDRFWILASHPENNLFAAGHDSGLIVFKLERERPAFTVHVPTNTVFYVKDRYLRTFDYINVKDSVQRNIRRSTSVGSSIRTVSYNPLEKALLVSSFSPQEVESGTYELYPIAGDDTDAKRGFGLCAVFVARNRFAVLDKNHQIIVKNLKNEVVKKISVPDTTTDMMFPAQTGTVLLRSEEKITLFDVQQKRVLAELTTPMIRHVYWSSSEKDARVALVGKDVIIIANKKLEQLCTVQETIRIKSGAWTENNVFIYNTLTHIKYCLPNGDSGIIRTFDVPIYITAVKGNKIFCIDRECKNRIIAIDTTEFVFKLALIQNKIHDVLKMVKDSHLIGQAIIAYIEKKGFSEVALHFVKDEKTRFNLALECGNIDVALQSATALDQKDCWNRLGMEALRQGNHQVVEMAYQRTNNFERLSFLYLITGNVRKLQKMLKIAERRGDIQSRFHNSLYLGDISERVKVLEDAGQFALAYSTAQLHNLQEEAERLAQTYFLTTPLPQLSVAQLKEGKLLVPPIPILHAHESNWPLLTVQKPALASFVSEVPDEEPDQWIEEDAIPFEDPSGATDLPPDAPPLDLDDEEKWELELELDPSLNNIEVDPVQAEVFISAALSPCDIWRKNSKLAADNVAAGAFDVAMQLLNQQLGIVNFEPLRGQFQYLYYSARGFQLGLPLTPSLPVYLRRNPAEPPNRSLPAIPSSLSSLIDRLKSFAYKLTTGGKFSEALEHFFGILHSIPLMIVDTVDDFNAVKDLIQLCREYILGLRLELKRKELTAPSEAARQVELAAYFTHCNLQPIHLMLSLRSAMNAAYKIKNFVSAASFARRLMELNPKPEIGQQAMKVIKYAEQNPKDAEKLNYQERNPFVTCGISFTPIYKGKPSVQCPFCQSHFLPEHMNALCPNCRLSQIGISGSGLNLLSH